MIKTLMPFQEVGRDFLAGRPDAILADDMGLGKTVQAIEAMKLSRITNGVIITPQTIRHDWVVNLNDQAPGLRVREISSPRVMPDLSAINVVNYDIIWREPLLNRLKEASWDLLLADESHALKNIKSKRAKSVLGRGGLYSRCKNRWLMTGTPVLNRPMELYAPLRALCPEILGAYVDYYKYAYRFCAAFQDTFGFNTDGASNLSELAMILRPVMLRRMKREVLKDLPEETYQKIYLPPTNELAMMCKETGEGGSIRKALGMVKTEFAIKHIEELLETKNKIVAFTWHRDVAKRLGEYFGPRAVLHTGEETEGEKRKAKNYFMSDDRVQVFIGQLEASGIGIDGLQEVCDTAVFVEITGVPGKIRQAVDRLKRIGQKSSVLAQFLVSENSEDEKIVNTLIDKSKTINTIMGEKGDVEFVKVSCHVCGVVKEMKALKRAAGLAVCDDCSSMLECFD